MFTLKGRQDSFRLLLPDNFIVDDIKEKYEKVLKSKHSFIEKPIDFVNESIQSIQVLGFIDGTVAQQQHSRGTHAISDDRKDQNRFLHTGTDYTYRSEVNPLQLIDKTLNINFRHTLGFLNYFLLFENFFYLYQRDTKYKDLPQTFVIDILNENGSVYCKVVLYDPVVSSMDMLDLSYTQPISQSQTFKVEFKYSNIDFQFISAEEDTEYDVNDNVIRVNN